MRLKENIWKLRRLQTPWIFHPFLPHSCLYKMNIIDITVLCISLFLIFSLLSYIRFRISLPLGERCFFSLLMMWFFWSEEQGGLRLAQDYVFVFLCGQQLKKMRLLEKKIIWLLLLFSLIIISLLFWEEREKESKRERARREMEGRREREM